MCKNEFKWTFFKQELGRVQGSGDRPVYLKAYIQVYKLSLETSLTSQFTL